jgi:hypothetical protein
MLVWTLELKNNATDPALLICPAWFSLYLGATPSTILSLHPSFAAKTDPQHPVDQSIYLHPKEPSDGFERLDSKKNRGAEQV